ncbi:hypothetical protein ASG80_02670 [Agromyces sp. Soil535]|nr:hypothetical protein ASG80_02670 [Agromyces sp. Soil535]
MAPSGIGQRRPLVTSRLVVISLVRSRGVTLLMMSAPMLGTTFAYGKTTLRAAFARMLGLLIRAPMNTALLIKALACGLRSCS